MNHKPIASFMLALALASVYVPTKSITIWALLIPTTVYFVLAENDFKRKYFFYTLSLAAVIALAMVIPLPIVNASPLLNLLLHLLPWLAILAAVLKWWVQRLAKSPSISKLQINE